MTTTWTALRHLLTMQYKDLHFRLTRQLGSEDLARESLHETWLRLHRHDEIGPVERPISFLLQIAGNIGKDRRRAERRRARRSNVDAAAEIADTAPGPAREAMARIDLDVVEQAIRDLPPRARTVLIAIRHRGLSHEAIAAQLGISRRTVFYELRAAIELLEARLARKRPSNGRIDDAPKNICTNDGHESS
ncbi:sigma-70 family RNA polymerase sigma factor [Bradyrhizobium sp. Ai1a-2]|uniref:RNA polymerase sigma factor n=1 Tax=Bradyrhizobium sp. Ai1a-2 TaxID=196490 RepID=UPI000408CCB9|nr:sigma-70 family RNA polymerase sigma factor [Bradyrhizobium sp. Ai1a-2]